MTEAAKPNGTDQPLTHKVQGGSERQTPTSRMRVEELSALPFDEFALKALSILSDKKGIPKLRSGLDLGLPVYQINEDGTNIKEIVDIRHVVEGDEDRGEIVLR